MKIMKVIDKRIGNTTYYKYRINIPVKVAEATELATCAPCKSNPLSMAEPPSVR